MLKYYLFYSKDTIYELMKSSPEEIISLKENQVFVFGSNASGFHGAGAAGLACRGDSRNTWRTDAWFLKAMNSPIGSSNRIGKWAVFGISRGYSKGTIGQSYAIQTIVRPGLKRSVSLDLIQQQIEELYVFARNNPKLEFLVSKLGSNLAGYSEKEMKSCFSKVANIPENVLLPKEYL